jgi:Spy/CpxP family protein refolding chaperone
MPKNSRLENMKPTISKLGRAAAAFAISGVISPFLLAAADQPAAPAAPAPPAAVPAAPGGMGGMGGGGGRGGGRGGMGAMGAMGGMGGMAMVGLDDQQSQLFRDAMQKNREEINRLDEKLRAAQKELMQVVLAENYDEKVVREKADAVSKIQTDLLMLRCQALSVVAPTLKSDQRDELVNGRTGSMLLNSGVMGFGGGRVNFVGGQGGGQGGGGRNVQRGGVVVDPAVAPGTGGAGQPRRNRTNPNP